MTFGSIFGLLPNLAMSGSFWAAPRASGTPARAATVRAHVGRFLNAFSIGCVAARTALVPTNM
jgi:hypothetical protein